MNKSFWKSRTFWGAVLTAVVPVLAAPTAGTRITAAAQGVGIVLAAVGVRGAIAKNGTGQ